MEELWRQFKGEHPYNKSVAALGKTGGDKWKKLSDAEKSPYVEEERKRRWYIKKTWMLMRNK
ncbi:hypothetical protein P3L10_004556 [Capsicum annuum]